MNVFEMEGFLRGKCLPGDMKVNETTAEYLVRELSQAGELTAAHSTLEKAREVTNCPDGVDLQDHLKALVAENMALKSAIQTHSESVHFCEVCGKDDPCSTDDVCYALSETPTTDGILRAAEARGVEKFAYDQREIAEHWKAKIGNTVWIERSLAIAEEAEAFAQYLREVKA
jgi:hypothetical protein|nr:MAG TPA: hypothetical protein [Caudoviricetes sp.]